MNTIPTDRALAGLRDLEIRGNVIEAFAFRGTSSWVAVKNALYEASHTHLDLARMRTRDFLTIKGFAIALRSITNWFRMTMRDKATPLFVGAGSGVCEYAGEVLDSYLPKEIAERPGIPHKDIIYLLSATHLRDFERYRNYLALHQSIVFSLLISPLRGAVSWAITRPIGLVNPLLRASSREVSVRMAAYGLNVSPDYVLRLHARFVAGYILYCAFLAPLKISTAYIVSAYSYSDLVAALKRRKIPVIEVQHGVVGPVHRGYNYAVRSDLLPVPDGVYVYDEFWRTELISAGYYGSDSVAIVQRLKYELAMGEAGPDLPPYIVFTGQGLRSEAERFVRDFVKSKTDLHLVYVPHPNESEFDIASVATATGGDGRVHVFAKKICTTERLIIDSTAHISVSSSCHFDALYYKHRTYVLDMIAENVMHYYAAKMPDAIILVKTAAELLADMAS